MRPTPGPVKIQTLFPASDFAELPASHRLLVAINFRGDRTQTKAVDRVFPDKQIWISTTDKTSLSTVFAENHGANKSLVHDGSYTYPILGTGPPEGPRDIAAGMRFQKPFYYDPSQGNLLVEQLNQIPFGPNPQPALDHQSTSEFSFVVGSPDATSGNRSRLLPVLQFEFVAPAPGDFSLDGTVDAADYVVWRNGLGTTYSEADYDLWRSHFGETVGSGAALPSAEPLSTAVPEPSTLHLLVAAGIVPRLRRWSKPLRFLRVNRRRNAHELRGSAALRLQSGS